MRRSPEVLQEKDECGASPLHHAAAGGYVTLIQFISTIADSQGKRIPLIVQNRSNMWISIILLCGLCCKTRWQLYGSVQYVLACVPVSSLRAEQLWWAGQRPPTLGSGEEQAGELQGASGPGGRPQYPQHGPAVPSAPGHQPGTQQPGGGDDAVTHYSVYDVWGCALPLQHSGSKVTYCITYQIVRLSFPRYRGGIGRNKSNAVIFISFILLISCLQEK